MTEPTFAAWVESLVERFGTKGKVARKAGVSESAFLRQVQGGKLGIKPLLRLALATGEPASAVLTRANKADIAALIEGCYGEPRAESPAIRRVVSEVRDLPDPLIELTADWIQQWKAAGLLAGSSGAPAPESPATTSDRRAKRGTRRALQKRGGREKPTTTP